MAHTAEGALLALRYGLAVHCHAHHGSEHGTTLGGVPVRNVARHVLGASYRVYTLARHHTGWRLDQPEAPSAPTPATDA